MEQRTVGEKGPYGMESHRLNICPFRKIHIMVFLVIAGVSYGLTYKLFRGTIEATEPAPRILPVPKPEPPEILQEMADSSQQVSAVIKPRVVFEDEDVDAAVEQKIKQLQGIIDAGEAQPMPEDEAVFDRLNEMMWKHFGLDLDSRTYASIEHLRIDILRNYIRDQFLFVTVIPLDQKPKYQTTTVKRRKSIRMTSKSDGKGDAVLPELESEPISCDGLFVEQLRGDVVYICIQHFRDENLDIVFREVLVQNSGKFVLLNLQGNPGGLLDEVYQVCDVFPGVRLVAREDDTGKEYRTSAADDNILRIGNLICFFNEDSASAAEILLADLRQMGYILYSEADSTGKNAYGFSSREVVNGHEITVYRSQARIRGDGANTKIRPHVYLPPGFSEYDFRVGLVNDPKADPQRLLDEMIAAGMAKEE